MQLNIAQKCKRKYNKRSHAAKSGTVTEQRSGRLRYVQQIGKRCENLIEAVIYMRKVIDEICQKYRRMQIVTE